MTRRDVAAVVWSTSRADEGTISATGADKVADALERGGYLLGEDARRWTVKRIGDVTYGYEAEGETVEAWLDATPTTSLEDQAAYHEGMASVFRQGIKLRQEAGQ